jgi:RNA polymerase sigma-70 factor, ECF subfamily
LRAATVVGAERGDAMTREAFLELTAAHEPILRGLAHRLTGNDSDAGDLLQDCFERAVRRREQLRDPNAARSWLISILRNAFLDRCRRLRAESQGVEYVEPPEDLPCPEEQDEPPWTELTLEDLQKALEALEPEFRTVYELREFERLSYRKIAGKLGVRVPTVATRLFRARLKLRQVLSRMKRGPRHG